MKTWIGNPVDCPPRVTPGYPRYKFSGEQPPAAKELRPCVVCGDRHIAHFAWAPLRLWSELDRGAEQIDLTVTPQACERDGCDETARWDGRCRQHAE